MRTRWALPTTSSSRAIFCSAANACADSFTCRYSDHLKNMATWMNSFALNVSSNELRRSFTVHSINIYAIPYNIQLKCTSDPKVPLDTCIQYCDKCIIMTLLPFTNTSHYLIMTVPASSLWASRASSPTRRGACRPRGPAAPAPWSRASTGTPAQSCGRHSTPRRATF